MSENRYSLGGWLALVAAVLFPVSFGLGLVQTVVAHGALGYKGPFIGPSDGIAVLFTILAVYALIVFRRFLNERYQFHRIDTLITLSIVWSILLQIISLAADGLMMLAWPISEKAYLIVNLSILAVFMLAVGIIDILIGVRLMQARQGFGGLLKVFAILNLVAGLLEVSVFLSPIALILVPVSLVILGLLLLRDREEAEFV